MACNNCGEVTYTPCPGAPNCEGCAYTLNTDCVIYNDVPLSFESDAVNGSARTLTDLLQLISQSNCCDKPSRIVTGDYTVVDEDVNRTILLKGFDDGVSGSISYTLTIPVDDVFANKELVIKDITRPIDPGATTITWTITPVITYDWVPTVLTTGAFATLADSHGVLRLRLVETASLTWQWLVV